MSTQQWQRTLGFMALFLSLAWFALGFTPGSSLTTDGIDDYFPPPTESEIAAFVRQACRANSDVQR
ncbi:MAG: hypothetical protein JKX85_15435 [Phycisphaeraceae bacterium]|nr:hypothetical protein [Phycisphaeraceae bacterium]